MSAHLPGNPEAQRAMLATLGVPTSNSDVLSYGTLPCCADHRDWQIEWIFLERAVIHIRRLVNDSTGIYVEDAPPDPGGYLEARRTFSVPRGQRIPADLEALAQHELDGAPWRPRGGAPPSRIGSDELARTIVALTVANGRVPTRGEIATLPGYPNSSRVGDILSVRGPGGSRTRVPWPMAYRLALAHATMLDARIASRRDNDGAHSEDKTYIGLAPAGRAQVRDRLEKAGRSRG